MTRYGIISDIHDAVGYIPAVIDAMVNKAGVDKFILNGDICNMQSTLQESQNHIAFILDNFGKTGLETYIQPGSHETILAYDPVIEAFSSKYSNLIDAQKYPKITHKDHDLVFLPGSNSNTTRGEFVISDKKPTGYYFLAEGGTLSQLTRESIPEYLSMIQRGLTNGRFLHFNNPNDLDDLINWPDKTIVVCHVPRKFEGLENAVDITEFGTAVLDFPHGNGFIERGTIFPKSFAEDFIKWKKPVLLKREHRGSEELRKIYEEIGVTKALSGHFHESGHQAHDSQGIPLEEGVFSDELFYNSGCLENRQAGILTVYGDKVSYQNLNFQFQEEK